MPRIEPSWSSPPGGGLVATWMTFWFGPGSAANLGFCRVLAAGTFLVLFETRGWSEWAGMDDVLWLPTPLFDALDLRPASASTLDALAVVCKAALLLVTVGFMSRSSATVAAVLTFYLLGLRHNIGKVYYADAVVPLVLLVLAAARSGDRWSLDSLLRRLRSGHPPVEAAAGEYRWPVRLVRLLTVMIFFAAGVAKLRLGGLEWILSDQLADVLAGQQLRPDPPASSLGLVLAQHTLLCRCVAGAIVALETLSPLALVSARARRLIVPGLVTFTLALPVLFGFAFAEYAALFVFWVPWESPPWSSSRVLRRSISAAERV